MTIQNAFNEADPMSGNFDGTLGLEEIKNC
jgi:hypothetical protein